MINILISEKAGSGSGQSVVAACPATSDTLAWVIGPPPAARYGAAVPARCGARCRGRLGFGRDRHLEPPARPRHLCACHSVSRFVHPDLFLCELHERAPARVGDVLTWQAAALSEPPLTVTDSRIVWRRPCPTSFPICGTLAEWKSDGSLIPQNRRFAATPARSQSPVYVQIPTTHACGPAPLACLVMKGVRGSSPRVGLLFFFFI